HPSRIPAQRPVPPFPCTTLFRSKLTTSRLAKAVGMKTADLSARLIALGLLEPREGKNYITAKGKAAGGEFRMSPKHGPYFLWPRSEEHTSELQSRENLVCRLLLE